MESAFPVILAVALLKKASLRCVMAFHARRTETVKWDLALVPSAAIRKTIIAQTGLKPYLKNVMMSIVILTMSASPRNFHTAFAWLALTKDALDNLDWIKPW
jgi:hypothetical protein